MISPPVIWDQAEKFFSVSSKQDVSIRQNYSRERVIARSRRISSKGDSRCIIPIVKFF